MASTASLLKDNLCTKAYPDTPQASLLASKTDKGAMGRVLKKAEALLRDMVALTLRADLTRNQRTSLETCITLHMHQKEVTGEPNISVDKGSSIWQMEAASGLHLTLLGFEVQKAQVEQPVWNSETSVSLESCCVSLPSGRALHCPHLSAKVLPVPPCRGAGEEEGAGPHGV